MKSRLWCCTISSVCILGAMACAGDSDVTQPPPPPPPDPNSFAAVQQIFTSNCAFGGCHAGANPQEGMNLAVGQAYGDIVGVSSNQVPRLFRVTANDPDSSYLVLKIEGKAGLVGGTGTQMPLGGALTQAQIDTVRAWIAAGAQNN